MICGQQNRPRNASATRDAMLAAARERFARHSYDDVGLRDVARDAGVDAALISRYFGSKEDLFRDRAIVLELALGLVVFTVVGVGLLIHWLIPAMPLPVAFALAAILSPTDPIAVSAIASRAPIPKRMMHILEGESLLNDASGLVCMRFAVAAAMTGVFSIQEAFGTFLWVALGGLAIGIGVTWSVTKAKNSA